MRGALLGGLAAAIMCCAPASALDPIGPVVVPGVGSAGCATTTTESWTTQDECSADSAVATASCSHYDSTVNPPHETTIDSCQADSDAAQASCTRDHEAGWNDLNTSDCTADAGQNTVDCTRYETYTYVSNDDISCTATTAGGDSATCATGHTNDFFVTGDSSRTTGCATGDAACAVTTRPDTDPIDPVFPVPDGSDPAVTPDESCPLP
jgi:hypothetical protein